MARRPGRRVLDMSSDDDQFQGPMSPNTERKYNAIKTMEAYLGNANAEELVTRDPRQPSTLQTMKVTPRSEITGTIENKQAGAKAQQLNAWKTYSQTEEAQATAIGAKQPVGTGKGNSHRATLQAEYHPVLASTSTNHGSKRAFNANLPVKSGRLLVNADPALACNNIEGANKKAKVQVQDRGKRQFQERPWPPAALQGTVLAAPGDFMSAVKNMLPSTIPVNQSPAAPVNAQPAIIQSPQAGERGKHVVLNNTIDANSPEIRKIPVEEFSFPVQDVLHPGEISTHTDGAPSPASFSGFSAQEAVSPVDNTLMDTPIMDNVSKITVMKHQEYASVTQLHALETQVDLLKARLEELHRAVALIKLNDTKGATVSNGEPKPSFARQTPLPELHHGHDYRGGLLTETVTKSSFANVHAAENVGLGITGTAVRPSPESAMPSKTMPLQRKSTNVSGSIFGDSKIDLESAVSPNAMPPQHKATDKSGIIFGDSRVVQRGFSTAAFSNSVQDPPQG
ncbi:hypothetical protein LTR84_010348 [Exophiala bonariae]|uniref:Uncharacterized protein n=1 Tax=Exophiala bonariae TaxID=1690606 RepID=A0AAV9MU75_9EURO|nr:hypothetical protein LTR84_010348 [Exophiala bonariae]